MTHQTGTNFDSFGEIMDCAAFMTGVQPSTVAALVKGYLHPNELDGSERRALAGLMGCRTDAPFQFHRTETDVYCWNVNCSSPGQARFSIINLARADIARRARMVGQSGKVDAAEMLQLISAAEQDQMHAWGALAKLARAGLAELEAGTPVSRINPADLRALAVFCGANSGKWRVTGGVAYLEREGWHHVELVLWDVMTARAQLQERAA